MIKKEVNGVYKELLLLIVKHKQGDTLPLVNDAMWGYLYFNLPNNEPFSANNEISINAGNLLTAAGGGASECVGLAEMGKNAGFLVCRSP